MKADGSRRPISGARAPRIPGPTLSVRPRGSTGDISGLSVGARHPLTRINQCSLLACSMREHERGRDENSRVTCDNRWKCIVNRSPWNELPGSPPEACQGGVTIPWNVRCSPEDLGTPPTGCVELMRVESREIWPSRTKERKSDIIINQLHLSCDSIISQPHLMWHRHQSITSHVTSSSTNHI